MRPNLRFAPSPSGFLHVGGARTAIFNWLIAKKMGGKFRLRIEDTDKQRSTPESIRQILSGLEWLGLDWDDEIIYQGERIGRHKEIVQTLLDSGDAYRCFCSPQKLDEKRQFAEKNKINKRYDGACRNLSREEIANHLQNHNPFSVRFKITKKEIIFKDLIHGEHRAATDDMDDFIIQRSDQTPVYQLAVVVDDHDMNIDLIMRGDDHLSNTAKQIMIYQALAWPVPQFGHLPLIMGTDKTRLSKRHGAASVGEFEKEGILPAALFNYLCLLGWNPGTEQEKLSRDEIVNLFEVQRINNTPAVFDKQKLLWLNGKYLAETPFDVLLGYADLWLTKNGFAIDPQSEGRFFFYLKLMQTRSKTLFDFYDALDIYFTTPQNYDEKGVNKFLKKDGALNLLSDLSAVMQALEPQAFEDVAALEKEIRSFAQTRELSAAKVIHPLRLALTGKMESAGIFELLYILGREKTLQRIQAVIDYLQRASL